MPAMSRYPFGEEDSDTDAEVEACRTRQVRAADAARKLGTLALLDDTLRAGDLLLVPTGWDPDSVWERVRVVRAAPARDWWAAWGQPSGTLGARDTRHVPGSWRRRPLTEGEIASLRAQIWAEVEHLDAEGQPIHYAGDGLARTGFVQEGIRLPRCQQRGGVR